MLLSEFYQEPMPSESPQESSWNIDDDDWDAPDGVVTDGKEKSTIVHELLNKCPLQTQSVTRFWSCLNAEVAPCFMISASAVLYRISERICPKNILETTRDYERLFK